MRFRGNTHCPSKIFYLFQDIHVRNKVTCESENRMHIEDFMTHVVERCPYDIDFILETYDENGIHTDKSCYLTEMRAKFDACFSRKLRGECTWADSPSKRFHFNDVRINYDFTLRRSGMKAQYENLFIYQDDDSKFPSFSAAYHSLSSLIKTPQEWKDALMVAYKVNKQLSHCTEDVRLVITQWVNARVSAFEVLMAQKLQRFQDFMQRIKDLGAVQESTGTATFEQVAPALGDQVKRKFFSLTMVLGDFGTEPLLPPVIMDAYTVARMFRTFSSKRHPSVHHAPMRNIFLYTGAAHSDNYVELLAALGCTVEVEASNARDGSTHIWSQCIDVTAFKPWPLIDTTLTACVTKVDIAVTDTLLALFVAKYGVLGSRQ
jgi:hypothetical protein